MKYETLNYLSQDLKSLHEVLRIVNEEIFLLFDIQMTDSLTISSLSMKIFNNLYYDSKNKALPLITNNKVYKDIKQSYFISL